MQRDKCKNFIYIFVNIFNSFAKANDPFTQEIGLIKEEPEVVEVVVEETEPETEEITELENLIEDEEVIEETVIVKVVEKDNDVQENNEENIVRILNIDPITATLKNTLKGTALSKESKHEFKEQNKKIWFSESTHYSYNKRGETIETIAFRYGFSLREIEIANAIYPGRPLVIGDTLVIPNRFHIVKEGQSLNSVAARYDIDPIQLATSMV